jgi:hypothetical protein
MEVISEKTWAKLVDANRGAVNAGWASEGVFAPAVGPNFLQGQGLLYIGKSAGPLGSKVGSSYDQAVSIDASIDWMIAKKNKSAFWQFVDNIDFISKMDVIGEQRPPNHREWTSISSVSIQALREEIEFLIPKVTVFATSGLYGGYISGLLDNMGYKPAKLEFEDSWSSLRENSSGQSVFLTKHPQGWPSAERDRVLKSIKQRLA